MQLKSKKDFTNAKPPATAPEILLPESQTAAELQPSSHKKKRAFSPISLLVKLFLLGFAGAVVAAIALPTQMSCGNKAKHAEARQNVGAMNRAQQAYFVEKNSFSNSLDSLGIGIRSQTENYQYSSRATAKVAFNYGISRKETNKSYVGAVFLVKEKGETLTQAILCESTSTGKNKPADPVYKNGVFVCAEGTKNLY